MTIKETPIYEDAKSDWLKIVNKHKKRQKGLPALARLNTNAGNVEHNINMFNAMQPSGSIAVNPVNGNVSTSDGACCESISSLVEQREDLTMVELNYENLPIEVVTRVGNPTGYYNTSFGNWLPDDDDTEERLIDWSYEVSEQDIIEFLQDIEDVQEELGFDHISEDEYDAKLTDNFDALLDKYMELVLDHFREDAIEDAQQNYEVDDYPEYDPYDESLQKTTLDDNFDMSTRSIL